MELRTKPRALTRDHLSGQPDRGRDLRQASSSPPSASPTAFLEITRPTTGMGPADGMNRSTPDYLYPNCTSRSSIIFTANARPPPSAPAKSHSTAKTSAAGQCARKTGFSAAAVFIWNTPANAWYALHFWEHHAFSQDKAYLKSTAYPVLREVGGFWEDYLPLRADGTRVTPRGWSPEHGPTEPGVTYDPMISDDLFTNYLKAADLLGIGTDRVNGGGVYPNLLDAHPPFQIDGN